MSVIQSIDEMILMWVQNNFRFDWLSPAVEFFTNLGGTGSIWIVIALIMMCRKSTRKAGFLAIISMIVTALLTMVIKITVTRPRPYVIMEMLSPLLISSDPNSFPSGHTSSAFAVGIVWLTLLPKVWMKVVAVILAVIMGISRIYVGVHYPSDVLFGAVVGCVCGIVVMKVYNHFRKEKEI